MDGRSADYVKVKSQSDESEEGGSEARKLAWWDIGLAEPPGIELDSSKGWRCTKHLMLT